jgi:hypothetical protein
MIVGNVSDYSTIGRQMRYTPTLILLVAFLVAIAVTTGIYGFQRQSVFFTLICALSTVSGFLLGLRRAAARYPFFVVAALIAVWWIKTTMEIISEGWRHMDPISSVVSLIPSALWLSFCLFGSIYVYRG